MGIDYKNGKIYKLVSASHPELVYVGATAKARLCDRLATHNYNYRRWLKGKERYVTSFDIIAFGDASIVLLESWPCNSRDELNARERYWIERHSECVNKVKRPYVTEEELKKARKEYYHANFDSIAKKKGIYQQEHKEELAEKRRERYGKNREIVKAKVIKYYQKNKNSISKRRKEYRLKNKDSISSKSREYYQKNKGTIAGKRKEKCECSCGMTFVYRTKARHFRTLNHLSWQTAHPDQIVMLFREGY